ncbi:uncharacterized protein UV8b_04976 [Ustilaginoidea virens]|uniref:Magnesium dependent phosphatase n=1 Tax=Ustilaginoidea virens TaxID=1159556 RepID=A0A8E5HSB7_USTVR|nr:uncharacterized protein UV8b_04976 [Ustilaginoidea virens]QUC20735.1 hypothetical protein UV8b_04976 [Ustilaginoidea virens]
MSSPPSLDPALPLPKLIVFDLDYTLWPFWVDTHVTPPLRPSPSPSRSAATDKHGQDYAFYRDVPRILDALSRSPVRLGVASRTHAPGLARRLLRILHLPADEGPRSAIDVFDAGLEIYPGSKVKHFEALHKRTGIPYHDMLFFDDEARNRETERLGLTMRLVRDGVCWNEVESGLEEWRRRRRRRSEDTRPWLG